MPDQDREWVSAGRSAVDATCHRIPAHRDRHLQGGLGPRGVVREVADFGSSERSNLGETGGAYGLVGMRERAELIGGTLDAGPSGDGFRVLLRAPLGERG